MNTRNALITVGGIALVALALGACDIADPSAEAQGPIVSQGIGSKDASADVTLGQPGMDRWGEMVVVPVYVTNHSEKPSDYVITLAATVDGVRVDTDPLVVVQNLAPGASAEKKSDMWTDDRVTPAATFTVLEVSRTATN